MLRPILAHLTIFESALCHFRRRHLYRPLPFRFPIVIIRDLGAVQQEGAPWAFVSARFEHCPLPRCSGAVSAVQEYHRVTSTLFGTTPSLITY